VLSFDELLNQLARGTEEGLAFEVQVELGPELVAILSSRFYHSDEDVGRAVKSLLTDSINNHLYYEV